MPLLTKIVFLRQRKKWYGCMFGGVWTQSARFQEKREIIDFDTHWSHELFIWCMQKVYNVRNFVFVRSNIVLWIHSSGTCLLIDVLHTPSRIFLVQMVRGERIWCIVDQHNSIRSNSSKLVFAYLRYFLFFSNSRTNLFALPNLSVFHKAMLNHSSAK